MDYLQYLLNIAGNKKVDDLFEEIKKIDANNFEDPRLPDMAPAEKKLPNGELNLFEKQMYIWQAAKEKEHDDICKNCELVNVPNHRCPKKEVLELRLLMEVTRELMWSSIRLRLGTKATGIRKGFIVVESAPEINPEEILALIDALLQAASEGGIIEKEEKKEEKQKNKIIWN